MTEYQKKVFSDPILLRQKLEIYLQKPEKVEIYAKACESFFENGNKEELSYAITWSWWGFFGTIFFFAYRKNYIYIIAMLPIVIFLKIFGWVICGMAAKYAVCSRFCKILESENDENLKQGGGTSPEGAWVLAFILMITITAILK
ncbi:DUF2628 domain-containing protein [Campylobacter sp. CCUG 57310]|uniref:DUF2628 domain-containing protein n=1 Tax=Campylobacter sp. CCUG 57310 TaxID=2517362 RepID=UPI0015639FF4|nr:DUF2628 domain-containing protein [Campylobacter sp. CCUG 57310]QKF92909.1 DUF2628 domain-containing membrane protein [Campylobacter sp. CCUG 57310]